MVGSGQVIDAEGVDQAGATKVGPTASSLLMESVAEKPPSLRNCLGRIATGIQWVGRSADLGVTWNDWKNMLMPRQ